MSIGVDARTNSLIVSAPEALFREVKELVETLDRGAMDSNQTLEVVTLRQSSPDAVRRAFRNARHAVQFGGTGSSSTQSTGPGQFQPGFGGMRRFGGFGGFGGGGMFPGGGFPGGGFQPGGFPGGGGGFPGGGFPGMQQGFRGGMMQGAGGPVGKRVPRRL